MRTKTDDMLDRAPARVYRCYQCGGKITRKDTRLGVVGIPIDTSMHGCRRVTVHARCEITMDDDALGLY